VAELPPIYRAVVLLRDLEQLSTEETAQILDLGTDAVKQRLAKGYLDNAGEAYSKIVTRYPAMARYQDARKRLAAIDRPVPTPTPEAIALNKKEMASRTASTRYERFVNDIGKRPDLSAAVKVGQPTLVDPKETDAPNLVREINVVVKSEMEARSGAGKVSVETVNAGGKIPENQPVPRSAEAAVNPSDVPAKAPAQLNEAEISTSGDKPADKAAESTSTTADKETPKDASSSRKAKKKHHFKLPIPL